MIKNVECTHLYRSTRLKFGLNVSDRLLGSSTTTVEPSIGWSTTIAFRATFVLGLARVASKCWSGWANTRVRSDVSQRHIYIEILKIGYLMDLSAAPPGV